MSLSSRVLRRVLVPVVAMLTAVGLGFQPVGAAPTKPQASLKGPEAT